MSNSGLPSRSDLQEIADRIADDLSQVSGRGTVANYIPELATADPNRFGLAIAPLDDDPVTSGDADIPFSIQSISKVFSLTRAMQCAGAACWDRVGREPSGDPFNSIVQLEYERGIPRNPFINAGAIVMADVLMDGRSPAEALGDILSLARALSGDGSIDFDAAVAQSEKKTGARNRALAHFMSAEGNLHSPVEDVLDLYFQHCSIEMSCAQLATAGRYLANGGINPATQEVVLSEEQSRRVTALMMTCGSYDASGDFAFRVGLPAKSGVGGGILGVVPGVAAVAAWCPGLDAKGNSLLATRAFEDLVGITGWSVFGPRDEARR